MFGTVNEFSYLLMLFDKVSCWIVLLGNVMLAKTVSTRPLSVTFAPKVIDVDTATEDPDTGARLKTDGIIVSFAMKNVVSEALLLPAKSTTLLSM